MTTQWGCFLSFNSTKVRLKAQNLSLCSLSNICFNSTKVRLKGNDGRLKYNWDVKFQFYKSAIKS